MSFDAASTPPLIIVRGTEFHICGSGYDPEKWLKPDKRINGSYIVCDPGGSLSKRYGRGFSDCGYNVKALNFANICLSARYNPFWNLRSDKDAAKFAAILMCGTKGAGEPGDINHAACEALLLTALVSYIQDEAPYYEMNISTLVEMLEHMELDDDEIGWGYKTAVDFLFERKGELAPEHFSVRMYKSFKQFGARRIQRVVKSCMERLAPLNTGEMQAFFSNDELALDSLHSCDTALFVISGEPGAATGFLAPLMYSQLIDLLCGNSAR